MQSLWMSIEPLPTATRLMLSESLCGPVLKARLPPTPNDGRAVTLLLEALVAWYGQPLCAVLDADAEDVQRHPGRWALILGDLQSPLIEVEWASPSQVPLRDRTLEGIDDFRRAHHLIKVAATGLR